MITEILDFRKNIFLKFRDIEERIIERIIILQKKKGSNYLVKIILFSHYRSKNNPSIRLTTRDRISFQIHIEYCIDVLTRAPPFFSFSRIPFLPGWTRLRQQIFQAYTGFFWLHAKFMRGNVRTFERVDARVPTERKFH